MIINKSQEVYKTHRKRELYIHIFEPKKRNGNELLPTIVFFHGGGWFGSKPPLTQFFPYCEYFAKRGLIAFSAEYRARSKHRISPKQSVINGKSAISWIRNHSLNFGIDRNKVAAGGGSAGGHIALCCSLIEGYEPETSNCPMDSKPNALVLFNPIVDTISDPRIAGVIGGDGKVLSPMHHIKKDLPPTIIFHGTRNRVIPFKDVELFTKRMLDMGNRCELIAFERKGHAFFTYGNYLNKLYTETVRAADKFLSSLGYLKGEKTI